MKKMIFSAVLLTAFILSCKSDYVSAEKRILKVPSEYPTIAEALTEADDGDWIILSPGIYTENEIEITKAITISSEWKISGDESAIDQTVIDAGDQILFTIKVNDVEISGLKLINGDHTLDINARVNISHNHFVNNKDGMSFESGGGGYAGYNFAENDRDDALDLDIVRTKEDPGSDIIVEHNVFINSHDDGIEIRLYPYADQNIHYTIRENRIIGSTNAGIQLISYDKFTGKSFDIHHNIITNCKTGLGCMEGAQTKEDLSGASKMDESVLFYNNTLVANAMGATGGNNVVAFNNLVVENTLGGFKLFGAFSFIANNLFFGNGGNDLIGIDKAIEGEGNLYTEDPLINMDSFIPLTGSPCIDGGIIELKTEGRETVNIDSDLIAGEAPDIGALEYGIPQAGDPQSKNILQADAGEDRVIENNRIVLAGRIRYGRDESFKCSWLQEDGPGTANLEKPDNMVTAATLNREGIYRFSLMCTDGNATASDWVTIRYVKDGDGILHFLKDGSAGTIQAEDFAYSYGNVSVKRNKFLVLEGNGEKACSQIEYSIGMAEDRDYDLWLRIRSLSPLQNLISIEFNDKEVGQVPVPLDKKFHWVKLPVRISATAGQWPLLIRNHKGTVLLDKMIMSEDQVFTPEM